MTTEQLWEALEHAKREELRLAKDKKAADKAMNRLIGTEQEKQKAILEELDAMRAGRTETLPFTEKDWSGEAADETRDENV